VAPPPPPARSRSASSRTRRDPDPLRSEGMVNSANRSGARNSLSVAIDGRPSWAYILSNVGDRGSSAAFTSVRMARRGWSCGARLSGLA
jgi:hypothetical protein